MIRQIIFLVSVWMIAAAAHAQNPTICRLGFSYEISQAANWGKGKPVVTGVYSYSSAEQMGLHVNDIIEEIEGVPLSAIRTEDIPSLLNPVGKGDVTLTVSNLGYSAKPLTVRKECKRTNTITEDQLATAFNMLSLETVSERVFTCPFRTVVTTDTVDFRQFKSFAFTPINESNRRLEEIINNTIDKLLRGKGLTFDPVAPDLLVETFYALKKNPRYIGPNPLLVNRQPTYRYDIVLKKMIRYPFLEVAAAESEAEYLLQLGFRFVDQKQSRGRILWECEANELLTEGYRLENYAQTHIPLMCMQYPYTKYGRNVPFYVNERIYNYTGISFDINRLELVADVDRNSPAFAAGVRARDVIEKIDKVSPGYSPEELTKAYKQFTAKTMNLRDAKTLFTDANGFRYCMFWDAHQYIKVADAIQDPKNMLPFAYLFKYAPYINPSGTNACEFVIRRGKQKTDMLIRPTIRTELTVGIK